MDREKLEPEDILMARLVALAAAAVVHHRNGTGGSPEHVLADADAFEAWMLRGDEPPAAPPG